MFRLTPNFQGMFRRKLVFHQCKIKYSLPLVTSWWRHIGAEFNLQQVLHATVTPPSHFAFETAFIFVYVDIILTVHCHGLTVVVCCLCNNFCVLLQNSGQPNYVYQSVQRDNNRPLFVHQGLLGFYVRKQLLLSVISAFSSSVCLSVTRVDQSKESS